MRLAVLFILGSSVAVAEGCEKVCALNFEGDDATVVPLEAPGIWAVIGCEPVIDLTHPDEPIIGWLPKLESVDIDDPMVPRFIPEADGNEKVLFFGTEWVRVDDPRWTKWFGLDNIETSPCGFSS